MFFFRKRVLYLKIKEYTKDFISKIQHGKFDSYFIDAIANQANMQNKFNKEWSINLSDETGVKKGDVYKEPRLIEDHLPYVEIAVALRGSYLYVNQKNLSEDILIEKEFINMQNILKKYMYS